VAIRVLSRTLRGTLSLPAGTNIGQDGRPSQRPYVFAIHEILNNPQFPAPRQIFTRAITLAGNVRLIYDGKPIRL